MTGSAHRTGASADPPVDAHLRAALRHAPDSAAPVPPLLRSRIVAAAHRSAESSLSALPWHRRIAAGLGTPWRLGGAGTIAAALLAATVLWVGRDEQPGPAATRSELEQGTAPAAGTAAGPAAGSAAPGAPDPAAAATAAGEADIGAPLASPRSSTAPAAGPAGSAESRAVPPAPLPPPVRAPAPAAAPPLAREGSEQLARLEAREPRAAVPLPSRPVPAAPEANRHVAQAPAAAGTGEGRSSSAEGAQAFPQTPAAAAQAAAAAPPAAAAPTRDLRAEAGTAAAMPQGTTAAGALSTAPAARVAAAPRPAAADAARGAPSAAAEAAAHTPIVESWLASAGSWRWRSIDGGGEGALPAGWWSDLAAATRGRWQPWPGPPAGAASPGAQPGSMLLLLDGRPQGRLIIAPDGVIACDTGGRCERSMLDAGTAGVLGERLRR